MRLELIECKLYVNGTMVAQDDEVVRIASLLSYGDVPPVLRRLNLSEEEEEELDAFLAYEIFVQGNCLHADEEEEGDIE